VGCKNFEESPDRQNLLHLADAAEVRVQQQAAAETKLASQLVTAPVRPAPPVLGAERSETSLLYVNFNIMYFNFIYIILLLFFYIILFTA